MIVTFPLLYISIVAFFTIVMVGLTDGQGGGGWVGVSLGVLFCVVLELIARFFQG